MASLHPPVCDFGWKAPDFKLPAVNYRGSEGNLVSRDMMMGKNGLLVMFICNHCPYVKTIKSRLVVTCLELEQYGINSIAIQSNDTVKYPDDNFERMEE
ncbi:MAG: thioredoxin family protein, partial [Methylotenera sp.]